MAKKISQLEESLLLTGDEEAAVAYNGQNYKFKLRNIKQLISKTDVGLSNVNNTSDLDKPVSTAVQSAINGKAAVNHNHSQSDVTGLVTALSNLASLQHEHTIPSVVGLPEALSELAPISHAHTLAELPEVVDAIANKAAVNHNHSQSDVTGLVTALSDRALVGHVHTVTDITALDQHVNQLIVNSGVGPTEVSVGSLDW